MSSLVKIIKAKLMLQIESPLLWTAKDEEFIPCRFLPAFEISGTDQRTGLESTYVATLSWSLDGLRQIWLIGGHEARHALKDIKNLKRVESGRCVTVKTAQGTFEVKDNLELMRVLTRSLGDSISVTHKKTSGIQHTTFLDIKEHETLKGLPEAHDSYTGEPILIASLMELLI